MTRPNFAIVIRIVRCPPFGVVRVRHLPVSPVGEGTLLLACGVRPFEYAHVSGVSGSRSVPRSTGVSLAVRGP